MKKIAKIDVVEGSVLPVKVEFPTNFGNYRDLKSAMTDIRLFKCIPRFSHKAQTLFNIGS